MRQYGDLITRENYICFDGLAFEGVTHEKEGINWMHWNRMHENFDKLSGVSKTKRQRTDKIHPNIFNPLKNLDKPMVSKEHLSNLHSYWHDRVKEVGSWDNELWEIVKT